MADDTEARLREHAKYFDGLLSLIPAKLYFAEDNSDQWQRQKQTKQEAKAAKRAKLNPQNAKSAKDVFDERDGKRKRGDAGTTATPGDQKPATVQEQTPSKPAKKQKLAASGPSETPSKQESKAEAPIVQKVKAEQSQSKKERKRAANPSKEEKAKSKAEQRKKDVAKAKEASQQAAQGDQAAGEPDVNGHFEGLDDPATLKHADTAAGADSVTSTHSPIFDAAPVQSGTSSISSFPDVTTSAPEKVTAAPDKSEKPSQEELKLRLQKRLQELRDARKADKEDGSPAQSRQELLEERRKKDEERKARKKELRKQQKEEERRRLEETQTRSPLLSPSIRSPASSHGLLSGTTNNFSFGRVAFENGQTMTADLEKIIDPKIRKIAKDPKKALQMAKQHEEELSAMDPEKRADIGEKDMWLNAKKRAHGEKVKDDVSLLKKALKRKDKQKKKSEKAWDARTDGVKKSKEARQNKREENLQKRRDDKANKGSKKKGIKTKTKARPGFEGSFRAGTKRK